MDWFIWTLLGVAAFVWLMVIFIVIDKVLIYKHTVLVKIRTSSVPKVKRTRAKEVKVDGVQKLKLLYPKRKVVDMPPKEALNVGFMGNYLIEAYLEKDGSLSWVSNPQDMPEEARLITPYQRHTLKEEYKKAEIEKGKNMKELLLQFGLPVACLMIMAVVIVSILIFWQDLTEPLLDEKALEVSAIQSLAQVTSDLKDLKSDVQRLDGQQKSNKTLTEPPN